MNPTLILMRHAQPDDQGLLTRKGERQAQSIAKQLIDAGIQPDLILHSPLPRAEQTAYFVAGVYKGAGRAVAAMRVEPILTNDPEHLEKALAWLTDEKIVLAVTHEPQITHVMGPLIAQPWRPHHATAVVLEGSGDRWDGILQPGFGRFVREFTPE